MNVLSVCSGAGGLDLGLEAAGATVVGLCEIHPPARAVLARHWPDVPLWDDLTTLNGADWRGSVDLVAGGTPCTDLSMAGGRAGLGGEHSRIFWDFVRVARDSAARWVLWENVAGALSSAGGADFAAVLWGLSGHLPGVPADGWRSIGVCVGVERAVVWRVLDARWFGVAQRRRRVFALGCPVADIGRAIEVLVEPESVCRDSRPGAAAGEDVAGTLGGGSGGRGWAAGTDRMTFMAARMSHGDYRESETAGTLRTRAGDPTSTDLVAAFGWSNAATQGLSYSVEECQSLRSTMQPGVMVPATIGTITARGGYENRNAGDQLIMSPDIQVRRLTPTETERLMGWPDDHTRWGADGSEIADSHRYALCGNGVVAPVAEWIGRRLMVADMHRTHVRGSVGWPDKSAARTAGNGRAADTELKRSPL